MADIFISYASGDRDLARRVADVLAARGYSIWWDRVIPPGRIFDDVIQEALSAAKCVIVLWSKASVASNWVKTEAAEAAGRGILVPALIDDAKLPIEFKRIQSANLVGWNGMVEHPEFDNLLSAVDRLLRSASAGEPSAARVSRGTTAPQRRMPFSVVAVVIALAAVVGAGAIAYQRLSNTGKERRPGVNAVERGTSIAPGSHAAVPSPVEINIEAKRISPAPAQPTAATVPAATRVNLLATENGGQLIAATDKNWANLITGSDEQGLAVGKGEGVFAFKDDRPAIFDTFAVLIPGSAPANLKEFELLAGNDSPTGRFERIGTFQTQNIRALKSPYQEFTFPPVKAKYIKVRPLKNHSDGASIIAYKFRLLGTLE